jgi:hypothetical protein
MVQIDEPADYRIDPLDRLGAGYRLPGPALLQQEILEHRRLGLVKERQAVCYKSSPVFLPCSIIFVKL